MYTTRNFESRRKTRCSVTPLQSPLECKEMTHSSSSIPIYNENWEFKNKKIRKALVTKTAKKNIRFASFTQNEE